MSITVISEDFIHYEVLGRGDPVIFVHGWLGSWRYWWPSMQALSKQNRTFAFDLWGFGDSSKVPAKYSFEAYVDLLTQFIDRLGIAGSLTIIGHDVGAAIALRYARLEPDRIDRLVTVALPLDGGTIHDNLTNGKAEAFIAKFLAKSAQHPELEHEIGKADPKAVTAVASQLVHYDFSADLKEIVRPILMIFGERDPIIKLPKMVKNITFGSKKGQFRVNLEKCNHFPMLEETAIFNRLLLDFIHNQEQATITPKNYWQRRTR